MSEQLSHTPIDAQVMRISEIPAAHVIAQEPSVSLREGRESSVTIKEGEQKTPQYDLVIVDFHGTMTDHPLRSIRAFHNAGHNVLNRHLGRELYEQALSRPPHAAHSEERGEKYKSETNKEFIYRKFGGIFPTKEIDTYFTEWKRVYDSTFIPVPGMNKVIKDFLDNNIATVVLTNGSKRKEIQGILQDWGLSGLADNLYSQHIMEDKAKKPDVRVVKKILDDFEDQRGFRPTEDRVLVVGDYIDDMKTAHNMGMDSVLVSRGMGGESLHLRDPKPTYIVTDPKDLSKIVYGEFQQEIGDTINIPVVLWRRVKEVEAQKAEEEAAKQKNKVQ